MQLNEDIAVEPVSEQEGGRLVDSQTVVNIRLASARVCIDLEMLNPALLVRLDDLAVMVRVGEPVEGRLALLGHLVEVERLQVLAVSLIDVSTLDIVEQSELQLKHCAVLDRNQVSFWDLESVLWNVTEMCEAGLDSLVALLLGVLFGLGERCSAVEDAQRLEPLLEDLAVVWRQL